MNKILIVDDSNTKIERILKVLIERCSLDQGDIDVAYSVSSGLKAINKVFYDLVVLDLVLPQFDNENPDEEGGLSFLKSLKTRNDVNPPLQIICLTEHPKVIVKNRKEFANLMISIIVKKDSDSSWMDQLAEKVIYSRKLRTHIEISLKEKNKFDVGIICALQEEFEQLLDAFGRDKWIDYSIENCHYRLKRIEVVTETTQIVKIVASCALYPGSSATSALASFMYGVLGVDFLFMTGFTGGLIEEDKINDKSPSELQRGDIVVSSSVQDYAIGKLADNKDGKLKHLKEISQIQAKIGIFNKISEFITNSEIKDIINTKIINSNLRVEDSDSYKLLIAPTVSGPFVMTSRTVVNELIKSNRKLKAIDMEGYALYYTALAYDKPALWIKGVSDMADLNKDDTYHRVSAFGSALLLYLFIKEKLYD